MKYDRGRSFCDWNRLQLRVEGLLRLLLVLSPDEARNSSLLLVLVVSAGWSVQAAGETQVNTHPALLDTADISLETSPPGGVLLEAGTDFGVPLRLTSWSCDHTPS